MKKTGDMTKLSYMFKFEYALQLYYPSSSNHLLDNKVCFEFVWVEQDLLYCTCMHNKTATQRKRLFMVCLFAVICITLNLSNASALEAGSRCNDAGGVQSYEKFCASCHHSLEQSDRKGRSASRIGSALKHLGVHGQLAYLKKEVVESIACVLDNTEIDISVCSVEKDDESTYH